MMEPDDGEEGKRSYSGKRKALDLYLYQIPTYLFYSYHSDQGLNFCSYTYSGFQPGSSGSSLRLSTDLELIVCTYLGTYQFELVMMMMMMMMMMIIR